MKIKLQYAFFAFAALTFTAQAQNMQVKAAISKNTQVDFLKSFAAADETYAIESQSKAQEFALAKGLPLSGFDKDGNYFAVYEIDKKGNLIYYSTKNAGSRKTARVDNIKTELGLDLNGEDMTVGVWDGGVGLSTHVELDGRIIFKDKSTAVNRHATHVIGTVASAGTNNAASKGMAPKATIWSNDWNKDTSEMAAQAAEGLLVSNHSYGVDTTNENFPIPVDYFGSYDFTAYRFDMIAFNAPFYQPVVAAGNDRQSFLRLNPSKKGNDLLLGSSLAKNSIIVAAVFDVPNYTSSNQVAMSPFSSFGPTDDFRIKPDISAKGVQVFSTNNNVDNKSYETLNGTSMAAPAVSGVLILWQQYAIQKNENPYRSATLRALMVQTADETGADPGPDHKFGWGLINAKRGIEVISESKSDLALINELTLTQGATYEKDITVTKSGTNLTATLAWTDSPRNINDQFAEYLDDPTPALDNDLDLRIYKDGTEYFPWKLNKDFNLPFALKGDNDVDNIEKVEIPNAEPGIYKLVVSHKDQLSRDKQDFSLVVSSTQGTLSIEDNVKLENELKIWPNPANDRITIEGSVEQLKGATVVLYDIAGKAILQVNNADTFSSNWTIPLNNLSSGVYFLKFKNAGAQMTKKILVNK
ncbi:S8 family serine peptidase [Flavobacterium sp. HSC-61S13]|uniref:S8 family serine peptidase n=1 Tax=Flavobacterium sp. HSC-61S13 TaxID=2910963 RepID=UPI00209DF02A|nr:S8 family serine peptidase [Flavobacterium sp. HSC-61S13]MCP1994696.1 hypothetical protein [Flavobacterium sp. HSC-61S13]